MAVATFCGCLYLFLGYVSWIWLFELVCTGVCVKISPGNNFARGKFRHPSNPQSQHVQMALIITMGRVGPAATHGCGIPSSMELYQTVHNCL